MLTKKQINELNRKFCVPACVLAHERKVAKVAMALAKKMLKKGIKVDLELIYAGAMLHDLFRVCDMREFNIDKLAEKRISKEKIAFCLELRKKFFGKKHYEIAYDFFQKMGEKTLATLIKKHHFEAILSQKDAPKTIEEKIVFYADKRVCHSKIVPLKERFSEGRKRYGEEIKKKMAKSLKGEVKINELEKELFEKADIKEKDFF